MNAKISRQKVKEKQGISISKISPPSIDQLEKEI